MQGMTIQIFLPDGNPHGIRLADITSRTVQVLEVPRAALSTASKRNELSNVGLYFLVGSDDETGAATVYVGEAEDCLARLKQHHQQKDFWKSALVAISKTQYFTKTHVKYLEWYCHRAISQAGRYKLDNATVPSCPFVGESMATDLEDNFQTLQVLVSTLGHPLFDGLRLKRKKDIVLCKGKDAEAKGEWTEEGLVVFEGSTANAVETASAKETWVSKIRADLLEKGVLARDGTLFRFTRSYVFSSPSAAAVTVLGRNANGWTEWRFADGRSLDELRKHDASTA